MFGLFTCGVIKIGTAMANKVIAITIAATDVPSIIIVVFETNRNFCYIWILMMPAILIDENGRQYIMHYTELIAVNKKIIIGITVRVFIIAITIGVKSIMEGNELGYFKSKDSGTKKYLLSPCSKMI